jgi:hypothetical protein
VKPGYLRMRVRWADLTPDQAKALASHKTGGNGHS